MSLLPRSSFPVVAFFCVAVVAACATIEPAPAPLKPKVPATLESASAGASAIPSASAAATPSASSTDTARNKSLAPRVEAEGTSPGQESLAHAIVMAAKVPMSECHVGGGGGTLRIRVKGDGRSAHFDIEAGSSLDENARHCVLEALSTIDVPDTLSRASPSTAASKGFSSVITVQW